MSSATVTSAKPSRITAPLCWALHKHTIRGNQKHRDKVAFQGSHGTSVAEPKFRTAEFKSSALPKQSSLWALPWEVGLYLRIQDHAWNDFTHIPQILHLEVPSHQTNMWGPMFKTASDRIHTNDWMHECSSPDGGFKKNVSPNLLSISTAVRYKRVISPFH